MTKKLNPFNTDPKLETEGKRFDLGSFWLQIAAAGGGYNRAFVKRYEEITAPYALALEQGSLDQDLGRRLMMKAYFGVVVTAWGGEVGPEGEELEFTEENFIAVMEKMPRLWTYVTSQANSIANFRRKADEAVAGN